jgi:uncharacterized protein (DUF488 family)
MMDSVPEIFTIGHSTHEMDVFLSLLAEHDITAIADVRSQPFSRIPHFNRDVLIAVLKSHGIKYVPLGRELGARRDEPECYINGRAVYELIATLPLFQQGIERLVDGASDNVIALMCSEKEPLDCHRTILICRHLRRHRLRINHILSDGRLESQADLEHRLMELAGTSPGQGDLFAPQDELIERAYEARGDQIAYRIELQGAMR